jgi:hypothetical protein
MKNDEKIIGEAVRLEYDEHNGKLFIVFEIKDEKQKQKIKTSWTDDIEMRLVGKILMESEQNDE